MRIDVYVHMTDVPAPADPRIDAILAAVQTIITKETAMSASLGSIDDALTALTSDVANLTTVDASAAAAFQGLEAQLAAALQAAQTAGATPAQLQSFTDLHTAFGAQIAALSAAIPANTPAAGP